MMFTVFKAHEPLEVEVTCKEEQLSRKITDLIRTPPPTHTHRLLNIDFCSVFIYIVIGTNLHGNIFNFVKAFLKKVIDGHLFLGLSLQCP